MREKGIYILKTYNTTYFEGRDYNYGKPYTCKTKYVVYKLSLYKP